MYLLVLIKLPIGEWFIYPSCSLLLIRVGHLYIGCFHIEAINELVICRVDKSSGKVKGGDEVFLLCEKVGKGMLELFVYRMSVLNVSIDFLQTTVPLFGMKYYYQYIDICV